MISSEPVPAGFLCPAQIGTRRYKQARARSGDFIVREHLNLRYIYKSFHSRWLVHILTCRTRISILNLSTSMSIYHANGLTHFHMSCKLANRLYNSHLLHLQSLFPPPANKKGLNIKFCSILDNEYQQRRYTYESWRGC